MVSSRCICARNLGQERIARVVEALRAGGRELREVALLGLAVGHGEGREHVAEIGEREGAALGDGARRAHGGRHVAEEGAQVAGRLEPALGVHGEPPPDLVDGRVVARAGEHVVQHAPVRRGVADVVRRDEPPRPRSRPARRWRARRAPRRRRGGAGARGRRRRARRPRRARARSGRARGPASATSPAACSARSAVRRDGALVLGASVPRAREQAAEVLVAAAILDEEQHRPGSLFVLDCRERDSRHRRWAGCPPCAPPRRSAVRRTRRSDRRARACRARRPPPRR